MFYCERCHLVGECDCCLACGKRGLRVPVGGDYCFLIEAESMFGQMFVGILEDENIVCSAMPSGNGVRSQFGLKLEKLKIYVPYESYDKAKEILDGIFANVEKELQKSLADNNDKLFVSPRNEKKIKKKLKLKENESLVAYCTDIITNADSVVKKGRISSCFKGGEYLCIYKENLLIMVNSATYEIISITKQ